MNERTNERTWIQRSLSLSLSLPLSPTHAREIKRKASGWPLFALRIIIPRQTNERRSRASRATPQLLLLALGENQASAMHAPAGIVRGSTRSMYACHGMCPRWAFVGVHRGDAGRRQATAGGGEHVARADLDAEAVSAQHAVQMQTPFKEEPTTDPDERLPIERAIAWRGV